MTPGDGSGLAAHRGGIPGSIRGCARRSPAGSRACEERGETSARVPSACPSMRRRQESREEGANPTGVSSEPVSRSASAKSCQTAALERAGPLRPQPGLPPRRSRSRAGAEPGGSAQSDTTAQPQCPSATCLCQSGGMAPGTAGESLCQRPVSIPAPPAQLRVWDGCGLQLLPSAVIKWFDLSVEGLGCPLRAQLRGQESIQGGGSDAMCSDGDGGCICASGGRFLHAHG